MDRPNLSINEFSQKQGRPKPQIRSALFLINLTSGAGQSPQKVESLRNTFYELFQSQIPHCLCTTTINHDEVQRATRNFLQASPGPWLLLGGGGSGTTRAQIQAVMDKIDNGIVHPEDIYMSALRLGSGNIIAKLLGLPTEPMLALSKINKSLHQGNTLSCYVYRCICHHGNRSQAYYGATLAGIGQFGRVPQDVAQWRQRCPQLMTRLLNYFPLETVNRWQYVTFSLLRALKCLIWPQYAEEVTIEHAGSVATLRLFSGMLINFDFSPLPFDTGCLINQPHLKLCLIPYKNRRQMLTALSHWQSLDNDILVYDLTPERPINICFSGNNGTILALDEDIFTVSGRIHFEVATSIRFMAGGG